ncbi:MAG: CCA tRNA nucleotidyltransferase [Candidatus Hodarchaeota archaeon]
MKNFNLKNEIFPKNVLAVCQLLVKNSKEAFIVGGSIRDIIISRLADKKNNMNTLTKTVSKKPTDWDVATNATPDEVIAIFEKDFRVIPTGIKHGTVTIISDQLNIEVTTFRKESEYLDGRRPTQVTFVDNITIDLSRRDLTINAIAYDPVHDNLIDPFNGLKDIQDKIIRMVGDPDDRLEEDGLRLIRIFRFTSQLGFTIEQETLNAIPRHFEVFRKVSNERIHSELQKLLRGPYWRSSIIQLIEKNVLQNIVLEFKDESINQAITRINMDRVTLTIKVLSKLPQSSSLRLKFAVLFHQLSAVNTTSKSNFPSLNRALIEKILKRLKFSNKQIFEILHILKIHIIPLPYSEKDPDEIKNYSIRRIQYKIKPDYLKDYLEFFKAKTHVFQEKEILPDGLFRDILNRAQVQKPIELRDLTISGDDILQFFKLDKSQASQREFIGLCLRIIRERVEINPQINKKRFVYPILENLNKIKSQCKIKVTRYVRIVSTDHIRKLYQDNSPNYSSWESNHTYELSMWLNLCLLRKKRPFFVIFDGTNFNMPHHPNHRKSLYLRFKKYNPLFINVVASEKEILRNLELREKEISSIRKSDANIEVYERYKKLIQSYPNALSCPKGSKFIQISTYDSDFNDKIHEIVQEILQNNNRLLILGGNVLTGKTFTALVLQKHLEKLDSSRFKS